MKAAVLTIKGSRQVMLEYKRLELTCAEQSNNHENVGWAYNCLSDVQCKQRRVDNGKNHGASDGFDTICLCVVETRWCSGHGVD